MMNTLSWLIYIAGVSGSIGNLLTFIIIISAVATVAFAIFGSYFTLTKTFDIGRYTVEISKYPQTEEKYRKYGSNLIKYAKLVFIVFLFTAFLQVIIPNRQTIILIAASEIGEKMVTDEKVTNVVNPSFELLTTWIKKQTEDLKKSAVQ